MNGNPNGEPAQSVEAFATPSLHLPNHHGFIQLHQTLRRESEAAIPLAAYFSAGDECMATKKKSAKKSSSKKGAKKSSNKKYSSSAGKQVKKEMDKMKRGTLKSGRSGKKVTSRKQAVAIGLSEARKKGAKVPKKK